MKVAAALHSVEQHSQLRCLLTERRPIHDISTKSDSRAWMTYLSDDWYPGKESQCFPVQTMRVAGALHTARQHQIRMLVSRDESCQSCHRRATTNVVSQGAPVRWLSCKSRKLSVPCIDHEGGSCPAHHQAELKTRMLVLADLRPVQDNSARKRLAGSEGAPVRQLECMSRLLKLPSADHEGGSGPAHHATALRAAMLACRAERSDRCCF